MKTVMVGIPEKGFGSLKKVKNESKSEQLNLF